MRRRSIVIVSLCCALLFGIGVYIHLVREGFRHVLPTSALRQAQQDWQNRQPVKSLFESIKAFKLALECGARHQVARRHIARMVVLERAGDLDKALVECVKGTQILGNCDDEGSLGYLCNVIELEIKQLSPAPTPEFVP